MIVAFDHPQCVGAPVFENYALLEEIFKHLLDPKEWLSAVLVCKEFMAEGYRPYHRCHVHRHLWTRELKIRIQHLETGEYTDTMTVTHSFYQNYIGRFGTGRRISDNALLYYIDVDRVDTENKPVQVVVGDDPKVIPRFEGVKWSGTDYTVEIFTWFALGTCIVLSPETHKIYLESDFILR